MAALSRLELRGERGAASGGLRARPGVLPVVGGRGGRGSPWASGLGWVLAVEGKGRVAPSCLYVCLERWREASLLALRENAK